MADELEAIEVLDAELFEIPAAQGPIPYAVDSQGTIYVSGHLHPMGIAHAMREAEANKVTWVQAGAIDVLFPLPWVAAAALQHNKDATDAMRIVALGKIERYVRGRG